MAMSSKIVVTRLMVVAAFALMVWLVFESWSQIAKLMSTAPWWLLAAAVAALTMANIGMAVVFRGVVQRTSRPSLGAGEIVGSFLLSQVGKYVPGRIWGVAMQAAVMRRSGNVGGIVAANVELAIVNMAMITGAGIAFLAWQRLGFVVAFASLAATWGLGGWMLRLAVIERVAGLVQWLLPRLGSRLLEGLSGAGPATETQRSQRVGLLIYLLMYCLGWWLLARGVTQLDAVACMGIVAALSLSYVVGAASMLPAGIGAREGMLVLLAPVIDVPHVDMVALAVASRVAMVLMDALAAAIGAVLLKTAGSAGVQDV